jgi:hypothetical protein
MDKRVRIAVLASLIALYGPTTLANQVQELPKLVEQQQYTQAYELASKLVEQYEGDEGFDFYYAIAAIETGHLREAMFALERVLITRPDYIRAHLELGRVYFLLNDPQNAKSRFEHAKSLNPPASVQEKIDTFLAAIDAKKSQLTENWSGFIATGLGHDSNINSAADIDAIQTDIQIDVGSSSIENAVFDISEQGKQQSSLFYTLDGHLGWIKPVSAKTSIFFNGFLTHRENDTSSDFDISVLATQFGANYRKGNAFFKVPVNLQQIWLAGSAYYHQLSANLEWAQQLNKNNTLNTYGMLGIRRFNEEESEIRDVDFWLLGSTWHRKYDNTSLQWSATLYYSDENTKEDQMSNGFSNIYGRYYYGFRYTLQGNPWRNHLLSSTLGWKHDEYDNLDPTYTIRSPQEKEEDTLSLDLGWQYRLTKALSLDSHYLYTDKDSSLKDLDGQDISSYDRHQLVSKLKYQF